MSEQTALIVEDDALLRKALTIALRSSGFTAIGAATGADALSLISAERPDVVITDLGLPDMDGLELLTAIRGLPGAGEAPVVALSGADDTLRDAEEAGVGFAGYLLKPVAPHELIIAVRKALDRSDQAPPMGARLR